MAYGNRRAAPHGSPQSGSESNGHLAKPKRGSTHRLAAEIKDAKLAQMAGLLNDAVVTLRSRGPDPQGDTIIDRIL